MRKLKYLSIRLFRFVKQIRENWYLIKTVENVDNFMAWNGDKIDPGRKFQPSVQIENVWRGHYYARKWKYILIYFYLEVKRHVWRYVSSCSQFQGDEKSLCLHFVSISGVRMTPFVKSKINMSKYKRRKENERKRNTDEIHWFPAKLFLLKEWLEQNTNKHIDIYL